MMDLLIDINQLVKMAAFGLIIIGIAGIVLSTNMVRIIFALALLEAGANLLLVLTGYRANAQAPIINDQVAVMMVDPVPQALVLTAIVIGIGILTLALALTLRVHAAYGTLDIREIRLCMEQDISRESGIEMPTSHDAPLPIKRDNQNQVNRV